MSDTRPRWKFGVWQVWCQHQGNKKWFDELMAFMKKHQDNAPSNHSLEAGNLREHWTTWLYEIYTLMLRIRKKLVTHWQPRKLITKQRLKHFKMHLLVCFHQLADKQHFSITRKNRNSGTSLSVTLGNESGGDTSSTNGHGSSGKKATKNKAKMTTDIQSLVDLTHAHPEQGTSIMLCSLFANMYESCLLPVIGPNRQPKSPSGRTTDWNLIPCARLWPLFSSCWR